METTQGVLDERYEILEEIGKGGFGVVYKARQRTTKQLVAIKVLNLETASDPAMRREQRDRFTREMELIASLTSPHIVRLVDAGFTGDDPFMALEFIRGQELAEVLSEGPLDPELVMLVADHVLRALAEAHERGIVHRDLKPQNVMLTGSGRRTSAKVLDFGIAGIQESFKEEEESITRQGQIRGTPEYMAPEQFMFFSKPQPQMDVYALGLLLYECLTGKRWIRAGDVSDKYRQHKEEALDLTPALRGSPWGAFLERACAKEPKERFASADAMLDALHRMDQGLGHTGPISPDALLPSGKSPREQSITQEPALPEHSDAVEAFHSNRTLALTQTKSPSAPKKSPALWVLLVLLVLGAGGGAWVVLGGGASTERRSAEKAEQAPKSTAAELPPEQAAVAAPAEDVLEAPAPHAPPAAQALAEALHRAKQAELMAAWDEAIRAYQEALALQPDHAEAHEGLGFALLALKRPDEAAGHFETARKADELAGSSTFGLAQVKAAGEDWDAAEALCKESLAAAPSGDRAAAAKALLAELEAARTQRGEATRKAEKAAGHQRRSDSETSRRRRRASAGGVKVDTSI